VGGVGFAGRRGRICGSAWAGQVQGVGYPEAVRKWVVLLIAAVVVIAVVAVVLTQQSQQQARAEQVDQWHQDLHAWEESQAEALAAPEGPVLSEVVTGAAMTALPPAHAEQVADVDEVNAACTSLTAYASSV